MIIAPSRSDAPLESVNEQFVDIDVGLRLYSDGDAFYVNRNQAQSIVQGHVGDLSYPPEPKNNWSPQDGTSAEPNLTDIHGLYHPLPVNNYVLNDRTTSKPRSTSSSRMFSTKLNDSQDSGSEWAHWWICRCTPLPLSPPAAPADLATSLLENLADLAAEPALWNMTDEDWRKEHFGMAEYITNIPISEANRECMLLILQRYLRIAVEVHDVDLESLTTRHDNDQHDDVGTDYLRLPPTKTLHNFMELFLRMFEPFYPLLPGRSLDPNKLVNNSKSKALMLLLLSMLACGSMTHPAPEARQFSTVISEVCRLSMVNIVFKDPFATATPIFLHCALLSTIKGAFSGVKLHMSVSITHRNAYLTVSITYDSLGAGVMRGKDF